LEGPRKKFWEYLILAVPIAIVNWLVTLLKDRFFSQGWHALFIVVPLSLFIIGWIAWRQRTGASPLMGKSYFVVLGIFVLIFSICAGTDILNYRRTLVGYEEAAPADFLGLSRWGDWHYWFARRSTPTADTAIVTMDVPKTKVEGRYDVARLIRLAVLSGSKGIAFDFYFNENLNTDVDKLLCDAVTQAAEKKVPVLFGYGIRVVDNEPYRVDVASNLKCLPEANQGHLLGYAESDARIRSVPLYLKNVRDSNMESLSLKASKLLNSNINIPTNGLVQFVRPRVDLPRIRYHDLFFGDVSLQNSERLKLKDKFLFVGELSPQDSFNTPYGTEPGIVIHSFAVHSLRQNYYFSRTPWWASLGLIMVCCYLVAFLFDRRVRKLRIALLCLSLSVLIFLFAIIATWLWLVWIDVVYSQAAIWPLFALFALFGGRSVKQPLTIAS